MPDIQNLLTTIKQAEAAYRPSARIAEQLQQVTLVSLIGPSAVGKTTIMRTSAQLDSDFGRIISFTTRERRADEEPDTYEFLKHDEDTLRDIARQIDDRELVQFAVHPTTGHVYGSRISDYDRPFMMLDTLPRAFRELDILPFKTIKKIAVSAELTEWRYRFLERKDDKKDIGRRLQEGIQNLAWSLEQGDEVIWLDNSQRPVEETARLLTGIVKNEVKYDDTAARETGKALLADMRALKIP